MDFRKEVDLIIKGSAWFKGKVRPLTPPDVQKCLRIVKNHPVVDEYDVYLTGGVVQGRYGSDIDFVVSGGEFDDRKIFCYLTEITQQVFNEVGVDIDIHYMTDMSWTDGSEGLYDIYFAYPVVVLVQDGEVIKNRLYKNKKVGMLSVSRQQFPTQKSIVRAYDMNKCAQGVKK